MGYVIPNTARAFVKLSYHQHHVQEEESQYLHSVIHKSKCINHDMEQNKHNHKSTVNSPPWTGGDTFFFLPR